MDRDCGCSNGLIPGEILGQFSEGERPQLGQGLGDGHGGCQHRQRGPWFMAHAIGVSAPASGQRKPAPLRQLEQQGARRHVFHLPDRIAPVPERGQWPAQPIVAPVGMLRHKRPHLRQFLRSDPATLDRGNISHPAGCGRWVGQSPEPNGTVFLAAKPLTNAAGLAFRSLD